MKELQSAKTWLANLPGKIPSVFAAGMLSAASFVNAFAVLGQTICSAQMLSKQQFGELGIAMAVTLVACAVFDFRVWEVMTIQIPKLQFKNKLQEASSLVRGCFLLELSGGMFVTFMLLFASPWFSVWFAKNQNATVLFAVLALQPLLMSADEPARALLRLDGRFRDLAYWRSVTGIMQLLLVIAALMLYRSPISVAVATMVAWVIRLIWLAWLAQSSLSRMGLHPVQNVTNLEAWTSVKANRPMLAGTLVSAVAGRLANRIDLVLLGWFAVPEIVAPYDLARRLTSQVSLVLEPINQVIFPKISNQVASGDNSTRNRFLFQLTVVLAAVGLPVLVLVILVLPWLVPLVFGDRYVGAGLLSQLLMLPYAMLPLMWLRPYVASTQRVTALACAGVATVAVQFAVGLLLIPDALANGAAYSFLAGQVVWWICLAWISKGHFSTFSRRERTAS